MINFKKGVALIITMFIVIIICAVALFLLDKIIPISRNIKGIENGNMAYYNAHSGIEEVLFSMSGSNPGYETGATIGSQTLTGFTYSIVATGAIMPPLGIGNSDYDKNYNKIGIGSPLQLIIDKGDLNWNNIKFTFKIPDLDKNNNESLTGSVGTGVINWILSGSGNYLVASGSDNMIQRNSINDMTKDPFNNFVLLGNKTGFDKQGTGSGFQNFYNNLDCGTYRCSLKLSIMQDLKLFNPQGEYSPYLEYKITGFSSAIPLQIASIDSSGFSYGFKKSITRFVQQITTFEAFDFTIFQ